MGQRRRARWLCSSRKRWSDHQVGQGHRARVSQSAGARHGCWGGTGQRERFVIHMGGGGGTSQQAVRDRPRLHRTPPPRWIAQLQPVRLARWRARRRRRPSSGRRAPSDRIRGNIREGRVGQAAEEDPHARGTAACVMSRFGTSTHSDWGSGMCWNCSGAEPPRPSAGFSDQTLGTRHTQLPPALQGALCWALGTGHRTLVG